MSNYSLFSVLGLEIEYMLVDTATLSVRPKSDIILEALAGKQADEVVLGDISVSNELVMHVLEFKNNGPKPPTAPIASQFQTAIMQVQPLLSQHGLQLLPTGAHPWMAPLQETRRWPHGNRAIYNQFNRIFNCEGHGWSNLQSMHVNLPFANDDEFFQLHTLVRLILPLLPALAASTPFLEGQATGFLDSRLYYYGKNQQKIPSISGDIIPEFIQSQAQYMEAVLLPMYRDIAPYDPEGILQHEWLNSRAAIPKFAHHALEIRILDSQECVNADVAIAKVICAIIKYWHEHSQAHLIEAFPTAALKALYDNTVRDGLHVMVEDTQLLGQWQLPPRAISVREVWAQLIARVSSALDSTSQVILEHILSHGSLSERVLAACRQDTSRETIAAVYRQLGQCLLANQVFYSS